MPDFPVFPTDDHVIIQPDKSEEVSKGGIVLPEKAREKAYKGKVMAVGRGKYLDCGKLIEPQFKPGDTVIYDRYGGRELKVEGEDYLVFGQDQVIGICR